MGMVVKLAQSVRQIFLILPRVFANLYFLKIRLACVRKSSSPYLRIPPDFCGNFHRP